MIVSRVRRPRAVAWCASLLVTAVLAASGCSASPDDVPSGAAPSTGTTSADADTDAGGGEGFPRVVEVPVGEHLPAVALDVPAEPQRIVALTYETTELAWALGVGDRLVLAPEASTNPVLSNHAAQNAAVPEHFPSESTVNAEAVLAQRPDLVLLSARHGLESGVGEAITAAGVPVLVLPNTWRTYEDMMLNIELVGRAVGAEAAADELRETLRASGVLDVESDQDDAPAILVLSNQAGRPFVVGGSAFPLGLVRLAGGTDAGASAGITRTGPIAVEQIVSAAPEGIVLIDMNGSGAASFDSVLAVPAVAEVEAVASDHILLLEGRQAQALGLDATTGTFEELRDWIEEIGAAS